MFLERFFRKSESVSQGAATAFAIFAVSLQNTRRSPGVTAQSAGVANVVGAVLHLRECNAI